MALPKVLDKKILVSKIELSKKDKLFEGYGADEERYLVLAIGNNVKEIKENDRIYANKYAGKRVVYNNAPYTVIHQDDVIMILPEKDNEHS